MQKIIYFIVVVFLSLSFGIKPKIKELIDVDNKIENNVINSFYKESEYFHNKKEKIAIVLRISKEMEKYIIKVSILYKDDFKWGVIL